MSKILKMKSPSKLLFLKPYSYYGTVKSYSVKSLKCELQNKFITWISRELKSNLQNTLIFIRFPPSRIKKYF